jgi:hypothetical protein
LLGFGGRRRLHDTDQAAFPGRDLAAAQIGSDLLGGGGQAVVTEAETLAAGLELDEAIAAEVAAGLAAPRFDEAETARAGRLAQQVVVAPVRYRPNLAAALGGREAASA